MDIKARKKEFLKELYEYDIVLISKKSQERLWLHVESLLKEQEKETRKDVIEAYYWGFDNADGIKGGHERLAKKYNLLSEEK